MKRALNEQAIEILRTNDRGGYTIPTARLYPYQWNWDSAFVALGFMTFDRERAWRELEFLLEGQWRNGMVPSILFRHEDPDYFPGPASWQTHEDEPMPSTGLSQPPVLASIVLTLLESGDAAEEPRVRALFSKLLAWHRWFHTERCPDGCPAVCTVHPWESGRDNCPDWAEGLAAMNIDPELESYQRMDTLHANPEERPSKEQYDKFMSIVKFGRDIGWNQKALTNRGPFLMADPGIHFILMRADRDLLSLAKRLGLDECQSEIQQWIDQAVEASNYFWNEEIGAFTARHVHSGVFSNGFSSASALCFYADAGTDAQRMRVIANIERIAQRVEFMLPSWDPDAELFEPQRYWCGPVWPQMNYIIAKGLADQGYDSLASRIRQDMSSLIEKSGFRECFNPMDGAGCIGKDFSWTAAIWLAWASPNRLEAAA